MNYLKHISILLASCIFYSYPNSICFSQPLTEWVQRYNSPGNLNEDLIDMTLDKEGNIYLTGNTGNPSDIVTLKYFPNGILHWSKTFDGIYNIDDYAKKVAVDDSGFVYVLGRTLHPIEGSNYLTMKYSQNGDMIWKKELINGDSTLDIPNDMVLDDSSNVYITGSGYKCLLCKSEYLTVKYNKNGDLIWKKFFLNSGGYSEFSYSINLSLSNRISITGKSSDNIGNFLTSTLTYNNSGDSLNKSVFTNSVGNKVLSDFSDNLYVGGFHRENGQDDIYLNKYDSAGQLIWSRIYDTQNTFFRSDYFSWMVLDKQIENLYVTGNSEFNGQPGWEYLLLKYNIAGDTVWKKGYSPVLNSNNVSISMTIDKFNNTYITGSADYNSPYYRFLTVKYDSSGNLIWSANYTNYLFANHYAKKVLLDSFNNVYIAGTSYSNVTGTNDIALIKYSQLTSIYQFQNENLNFKLNQNFPNPFNPITRISYELKQRSKIIIMVYDIIGKEVKELVNKIQESGKYEISFDGSNLPNGVYFYNMKIDGNILDTKKLLLIK